MEKVDILAIGVHPDDVELSCGGTLALHKSLGHSFGILDLTEGELGTRGNAEQRKKEAFRAAEILGAEFRHILNIGDGFFQHEENNLKEIIRVIRACRPRIVFANALSDRHPDHGRAAKLVNDACFLSGLRKVNTDYNNVNQESWRPEVLYHYIQDHYLKPDLVVDISGFLDKKMESIMAFESQFYKEGSSEPESPISGKDFLDFIKSKSRVVGRASGVEYGEGFNTARPIGVRNIFGLC
ncbi:MAG: bacillithiol biosynthesis deacetylase BshB1 [Saprospiraceae bacterium]|nr:bacillithiol biosynthesis deacetylase BshB1 [Candidatus Vicinibacter affinis]